MPSNIQKKPVCEHNVKLISRLGLYCKLSKLEYILPFSSFFFIIYADAVMGSCASIGWAY